MAIGKRIKAAREKLKISQTELAEKTNLSKQIIYKYENEIVTNIPSDKIEKMAAALNTTPAFLMGWENAAVTIEESGDITIDPLYPKSEAKLLREFKKLNDIGRDKAVERVAELGEVPKYTKSVDTLTDADFDL